MPFARVGVMPQPTNTKSNISRMPGNTASGRQKGITMEDLKRQTAIRLAQKQHQHGRGYEEPMNQNLPQPQAQPQPNNLQNQGYPHNRFPQSETHRDQYAFSGREVPPPLQHRPQYAPPTQYQSNQYNPHSRSNANGRGNDSSFGNSKYRQGGGYYDDRGNPMHLRHQNHQGHEMISNSAYGGGNRFARHQSDGHPLTHGLTVQELKQMTRARLHAEAVEKVETDHLSPLDLELSLQDPPRERTFSRDSACRGQGLHVATSESTNSIPSLVQVGQGSAGRKMHESPAGVGRPNFAQPSESNYVLPQQQQPSWEGSNNMQPTSKMESFDNASTNSFNNSVISDHIGSDSALSGGFGTGSGIMSQSDSDYSATGQFNRSLSYSGLKSNDGFDGRSGIVSASVSPAAARQNMFAFDAAVGGNRRRAATLSPNPGSILEDRPHFDGQDVVAIPRFAEQDLSIPSFASAGSVSLLTARSRANSNPAVVSSDHLSGDSLFVQSSGMFAYDDVVPNRQRTESAVSLPPMSHTADEFGVDRILGQQKVSQGRDGPAIGHNTPFGGVDRQMRAPPGLSDSFGGFALVGHPSSKKSSFDSSTFDDLAGDIGSILHLAGGASNRERLNTYPQSSKQTPEYISEEFFSKDAGGFRS